MMDSDARHVKVLPDEFTGNFIPSELYLHPELNGVSDRELLGAICNLSRSNRKFTSIPYLAGLYGVSERNLRARIAKLENMGFLVRDDRNKKTGGSNFISPTAKCFGTVFPGPDDTIRPPGIGAQRRTETTDTADGNDRHGRTETAGDSKTDTKRNTKQMNALPLDEWFEVFWRAYPLKKDKKRAYTAFIKVNPDQMLWPAMIDGLRNQITERQLKAERGEWMPEWKHAATWLNGACWEDAVNLRETPTGPSVESWQQYAQRNSWLITAGLKTDQELYADWQDQTGAGVVCSQ